MDSSVKLGCGVQTIVTANDAGTTGYSGESEAEEGESRMVR